MEYPAARTASREGRPGRARPPLALVALLVVMGGKALFGQVALDSVEEGYYSFLALEGIGSQPTLDYRTLSDSVWTVPQGVAHPWMGRLAAENFHDIAGLRYHFYGPELFSSYNSALPFGQNDGALWQGRGLNASLSGGFRLEGYGLEATFKPQLVYSENLSFPLMPSAYDSPYGYFWAYSRNKGVDAPQRFGDRPLYDWSLGDSELRYSWKTLTAGIGTQAIWLGPAKLNPLLSSNNAPPYPKLDIGLRRTELRVLGLYLGDVEARLWEGLLQESAYFDSDSSNDRRFLTGLALAYAPAFLPGLSLFANRTFIYEFDWNAFYRYHKKIIGLGVVQGHEDQRAGLGFQYLLPAAEIEVFGEVGIDDFVAPPYGYLRYPFHTMAYTGGLRKGLRLGGPSDLRAELLFEWSSLEMSQDFQFQWPYSFYFHSQFGQGYTNEGQWLGAGIGSGGNSQYLGLTVYAPQGSLRLFVNRCNPDNNYLYVQSIHTPASPGAIGNTDPQFFEFKAWLALGAEVTAFVGEDWRLSGSFVYDLIDNQNYVRWAMVTNLRATAGLKYILH